MRQENRIPDAPRVRFAESMAHRFLLEAGPESFPFSARDLMERVPCGAVCLGWSEAKRVLNTLDPLHLRALNADARTLRSRRGGPYLTVYEDERVKSRERIRFSLMHELGHMVLGHLTCFEETGLCRGGGLSGGQYRVLETEADAFAGELLAPSAFFRFTGIGEEELKMLCGLSAAAAQVRMERIREARGENESGDSEELRHLLLPLYEKKDEVILRAQAELPGREEKPLRVCGRCGRVSADREDLYCAFCGARLKEENGAPARRQALPEKMPFCPRCGNEEIGEKDEFCFVCGSALKNRCLRERTELRKNALYCPRCGSPSSLAASLRGAEEALSRLELYAPGEGWQEYPGTAYVKDAALREGKRTLYTALCFSRLYVNDGEDLLAITAAPGFRRDLIKSSGELLELSSRFEKRHRCLGVYTAHDL